jgi:arylsulfatase A-like enzyme
MLAIPLLLLAAAAAAAAAAATPRLIISILVDDLGSGDPGWAGSQIATPTLDRLRADGVALSRMYVQPICTPTRASFLTGRHALALGLQGKQTVQQGCAWGLDVAEQTFVQALQGAGWSTHMVGKAHLGADRWRRTPTYRGFNTFTGYLYGAEDYFSHVLAGAYDLRNDTRPECGPGCSQNIAAAHNGTYSTPLLAAEVVRLVQLAATSPGPTYIHFTPQAVHAPLQAPEAYVAPYRRIFGPGNAARAIHAGALACLDAALANITAAIAAAGLADETLIWAGADNGGPLGDIGDGTMASNYPWRGGKHSLYEGGVRAASLAWGWGLGAAGRGSGASRSWAGLAHVVDVGATLLEAAGVAPLPPLPGRPTHGVSFWGALRPRAPRSFARAARLGRRQSPLPRAARRAVLARAPVRGAARAARAAPARAQRRLTRPCAFFAARLCRLLLLATGESSFPAGRFSALYVLEQTAAGAMFVRAEVLRFGAGAR